jgi:uncharacterized alpha-E superfamily protein
MLSRAAERVYWTGRYLERAENIARIVQQYSQLLLDLPDEVGVGWVELVRIFGATDLFDVSGRGRRETDILAFLLAEPHAPPSLAYSLKMARENIRNTRDLLPHESWESVNELYHWAGRHLGEAARGGDRFETLSEIIGRCQQIHGTLTGTMSHDSPYRFLELGRSIERADMTSRVIDVAAAYIRHNERLVRRYGSSLWTNVLKSVSGFQMYRQYCQPQVEGARVIGFLVTDGAFPRAIASCIDHARKSCHALPRGAGVLVALDGVETLLGEVLEEPLDADRVSRLMDRMQKRLGRAHDAVVDTWFLPGHLP